MTSRSRMQFLGTEAPAQQSLIQPYPQPMPMANVPQTGTVIPVPMSVNQTKVSGYPKKSGKGLAYTQLTCGVLSIVLEIINMFICPFPVGAGIWSGIFYTTSGVLGIYAARTQSRCMIIAFMVMSIISAVVSAFGLSMAIVNASISYCRNSYEHSYELVPAFIAILGFVEMIIAIISASICCRHTCCGAGSPQQTIVYYAAGGPNLPGGPNPVSSVIFVPASAPQPTIALPIYNQQMPSTSAGSSAVVSTGLPLGDRAQPPAYDSIDPGPVVKQSIPIT